MSYLILRRRSRPKKRRQMTLYVLMGLIATLFLVAILAPVIAPNDPYQTDIMNQQQGPSAKYPFGTDHLGRCVLSRILYGATTSLFSSLGIITIVFLVGSVLGILAGYFGGVLDTIIMRITTILQAFPRLILAIALAGVLGVGIGNTILALCVIYWTEYARIARSLVLSIKERTYIKSARVCGENHTTIIVKHVIPNVFPSLIVTATLDIGTMIMEVAALSYLGLGVKAPMSEWGSMMNLGKQYLQTNPWLIVVPGVAIFITVIIFNLFGDKLRDALDLQ
ncbi:MAG: ABC transporter permease [Clostridiales bacterium]|jgi:ABC-type dipeptide/oligopeptide/nickel transport system permease subunit|nr:ABC transporter permease [Clostridiales bacterium]